MTTTTIQTATRITAFSMGQFILGFNKIISQEIILNK